MLSKEEKKSMEEQLKQLQDAYSEILNVFHNTKHVSVSKSLHNAIFDINRAIKDIEITLGVIK